MTSEWFWVALPALQNDARAMVGSREPLQSQPNTSYRGRQFLRTVSQVHYEGCHCHAAPESVQVACWHARQPNSTDL